MTRAELADAALFQHGDDRADILLPSRTSDSLVSLLSDIVYAALRSGETVLVTSVRSSHGDDSGLGPHSHALGGAADLWLLWAPEPTAYISANDARFAAWLREIAGSPNLYQIGLSPGAVTRANVAAAGPTYFADKGDDHVHVGALGDHAVNPTDEFNSLASKVERWHQDAKAAVTKTLNDPLGIGAKIDAERTALLTQYGPLLSGLAVGLAFVVIGALLLGNSWGESLSANVGRIADKLSNVATKAATVAEETGA